MERKCISCSQYCIQVGDKPAIAMKLNKVKFFERDVDHECDKGSRKIKKTISVTCSMFGLSLKKGFVYLILENVLVVSIIPLLFHNVVRLPLFVRYDRRVG